MRAAFTRLVGWVRAAIAYGRGVLRDPISGDPSSTRIIAFMFATTACVVALITAWRGHEAASTVVALSGGGVGGILGRAKAQATGGDA